MATERAPASERAPGAPARTGVSIRGAGRAPDLSPRDELLTTTEALCPVCLRVLPARTVARGGEVRLVRSCADHGVADTLVVSDAAWWKESRRFLRPGRRPAQAATSTEHGCPYDCGFCPEHEQHACVTVFEITEACNLACPACFAGDAHVRHRTLDDVHAMLSAVLAAEGGQADVVMLSGGEPTLHPALLDVVDAISEAPVRYVVVNTNGVRLAREPALAHALAERGALVYLQFDGFSPETYQLLRGRPDLLAVKERALENLTAAGASVVLVATVVKGVNDGELGELVDFGARHPAVRAVSVQPEFGEGRFVPFDPGDRMTVTDAIAAIGRQSDVFDAGDFVPIPCCDPVCTAATYAWARGDEVTPVTRLVPVEAYLEYLENTSLPNLSTAFREDVEEMRETLLRLFSKSAPPGSERQAEAFRCACEPLLAELGSIDDLPGHVFAVTIEGFMDRHVFDLDRARRCCIQEALPDGRLVPFCAYNTLYRFAPGHHPSPP